MSLVHAPYGFVPISEDVYLPTWQGAVLQDQPFEDSVSGTIDLRIVAETPIFVRGSVREEFFRAPDETYAIPGSAVRGAIRNVIEIATFGWMGRVNDHRYGVRDLHNQDLYVRHMAGIMTGPDGRKSPMPKVIAGWLRKQTNEGNGKQQNGDIVATITPCHFAKIEYRLLMATAQEYGITGFSPGDRQSAVNKYRTWGHRSRIVKVQVEPQRRRSEAALPYDFGRVVGKGTTEAELVFTGQPSQWRADQPPRRGGGHAKHHDFVFYGEDKNNPIPVTRRVFDGFEFVHSDRGQQNARNRSLLRNEEWEYWWREYDADDRDGKVPVFFLVNEEHGEKHKLRAFGLAMMFRLAYDYSVMDAVRNSQAQVGDPRRPLDFAQTLFGNVADEADDHDNESLTRGTQPARNVRSLKGRLSFGMARAEANPKPLQPVETVLGTPKASYYPAYVEQQPEVVPGSDAAIVQSKPRWKTWMDTGVQIRGWKRYWPQPEVVKPLLPTRGDGRAMDVSRVASRFAPLPAGTSFLLRLRLHNVRLSELGAILWALDFGQDSQARHTLGMARSLGYGRCRFEVAQFDIEDVGDVAIENGDDARVKFEGLMEGFALGRKIPGGWAHSRQIFELHAMAHTLDAKNPHRAHMRIDDPVVRNQFQNAKLAGQALPAAGLTEHWRAGAKAAGHEILPLPKPMSSEASRLVPVDRPKPGHSKPTQMPPVSGIKGGTRLEAELTGLTKTGKWRAKVSAPSAEGVISQGNPPADAAAGNHYTVTVTAGGDLKNLQMKWD